MTIRLPGSARSYSPSYCYILQRVIRRPHAWDWSGSVARAGAWIECDDGALVIEAAGPVRVARGHLAHDVPHIWRLHRLDAPAWHEIATVEALRGEWRDELLPLADALLRRNRLVPDVGRAIHDAEASIQTLIASFTLAEQNYFLSDLSERINFAWARLVGLSPKETLQTDLSPERTNKHYRTQKLPAVCACVADENNGSAVPIKYRKYTSANYLTVQKGVVSSLYKPRTFPLHERSRGDNIADVTPRQTLADNARKIKKGSSVAERSEAAKALGYLAGRLSALKRAPRMSELMRAAANARWAAYRAAKAQPQEAAR